MYKQNKYTINFKIKTYTTLTNKYKRNGGSAYMFVLFLMSFIFSILAVLMRFILNSTLLITATVSYANFNNMATGGIDIGLTYINNEIYLNKQNIKLSTIDNIQNANINPYVFFNSNTGNFYLYDHFFNNVMAAKVANYSKLSDINYTRYGYNIDIYVSNSNGLLIQSVVTKQESNISTTLNAIIQLNSDVTAKLYEVFEWYYTPSIFLSETTQGINVSSILNNNITLVPYSYTINNPVWYSNNGSNSIYIDIAQFYNNGTVATAIIHSGFSDIYIYTSANSNFKGIIISNGSITFANDIMVEGSVITQGNIYTQPYNNTMFLQNSNIIFEIDFYDRYERRNFLDKIGITNFYRGTDVLGYLSLSNTSQLYVTFNTPFMARPYIIYEVF